MSLNEVDQRNKQIRKLSTELKHTTSNSEKFLRLNDEINKIYVAIIEANVFVKAGTLI